MGFLLKFFGKINKQSQPVKKEREEVTHVGKDQKEAFVGEEISKPHPISVKMSNFSDNLPSWIGDENRWGYNKKDALIVSCDNPDEGVGYEYDFMVFRSIVEVTEILNMKYAGYEREKQTLVGHHSKHYDILYCKVYAFTNEDWEFLKNDFESHNGYQEDEEGMNRHNQLRKERLKYYKTQLWVDINMFYGKH